VSDIFNEVDEEVRRDQLKKLWERWGNYIVAAAVLVVLAVGAWRGYQYWELRKAVEAGAAFDAAMQLADAGKHNEAEEAFAKLATNSTAGYRMLARLRQAAEIAERDPKAAIAEYDAIAAAAAGQPLIAELAQVRAGYLLVDTAPLAEITRRLEPLAQPSGTFRHSAREILALSAWRNGDVATAKRWADAAKADPEAPTGVRTRADVLSALLPEAGKP
jgi:hypothetical protein